MGKKLNGGKFERDEEEEGRRERQTYGYRWNDKEKEKKVRGGHFGARAEEFWREWRVCLRLFLASSHGALVGG